MNDVYQSDEEQIEALKKWWRENGTSTIIGIALAVAAVFGWQGWQKQQQQAAYSASMVYQQLTDIVAGDISPLTDEQKSTAKHLSETLKQDYSGSAYATFAAWYKAKLAVTEGDLEAAEAELRWALTQLDQPEITAQTNLRLARVLTAKKQYDDALSLLANEPLGFTAQYQELRGDIFLQQGDAVQAKAAYEMAKASNALAERPANNPLLELKIQHLASAEGA